MPNFKRNKRDGNEPEIIEALQRCGVSWRRLPPGAGADLVISPNRTLVSFVEVKTKGGRLTRREIELQCWCQQNDLTYLVLHDAEEVFETYLPFVKEN